MRKLFIVFAVVAGLFGLQGSLAMPTPPEKARTEVVIHTTEQEVSFNIEYPSSPVLEFFEYTISLKPQVLRPHILTLLSSSIYFHSGL